MVGNSKPVDVFDTDPLRYLFSADTSNLTAESVVAVAWSTDGEYLYGVSNNFVRWKNGGLGPLERVAELPSNCCLAYDLTASVDSHLEHMVPRLDCLMTKPRFNSCSKAISRI